MEVYGTKTGRLSLTREVSRYYSDPAPDIKVRVIMAILKRNIIVVTSSSTGYSETQIPNPQNYGKHIEKFPSLSRNPTGSGFHWLCSPGAALEAGCSP